MASITLDWNEYLKKATEVVEEGCVLLENKNQCLPFEKDTKVAIFGRIQKHYYKSGTGSGGMVNVSKVVDIVEGLKNTNHIKIDSELESLYEEWEKENPFELGLGWGNDPTCQKEMPVTLEQAKYYANKNQVALIILGRTAGEDMDNTAQEGSWFLTNLERQLLENVRKAFAKVVVVLNNSNIIDMNFVQEYNIDSVLIGWQGGIIGGQGVANVLTGLATPSGKLSDTIAKSIEDYPAHTNFGNPEAETYQEDIYVGYRYFETFAKDKVLYPFGYGLSYTNFEITKKDFNYDFPNITLEVEVKNTGNFSGKEVVQIYLGLPEGKLGKPAKTLCGFQKTKLLAPNETQTLSIKIDIKDFASYDDLGLTGKSDVSVLEEGKYQVFVGNSVKDSKVFGEFNVENLFIVKEHYNAMPPQKDFTRFKAQNGKLEMEEVKGIGVCNPIHGNNAHRNQFLEETKNEYDKNLSPKTKEILNQLTDQDLFSIIRGEGMSSPKVTPGTAAAFGGVNPHMKELGIPCGCCSDGPSGMRLDSGAEAFNLPNGTLQACSFNPELVTELYTFLGYEMSFNKVDVLLGPGMNIHRYPLNGRNFEYFSEDPYLTGIMASANVKGLKKAGNTGSLKHFCGNNQETGRNTIDCTISQRALREIYLKGFEIAVKNGADIIMTTYGSVNGMWTAGNFDLNTLILRKEWGFSGILITDWWSHINSEGEGPSLTNFAQMARAQNDIYMTCQDGAIPADGENTEAEYKAGKLDRAELLRNAGNIIEFLSKTNAQKRLEKTADKVEIINRVVSAQNETPESVEYFVLKKEDNYTGTFDFSQVSTKKGTAFTFGLETEAAGSYQFTLEGKTGDNALAQIPVGFGINGLTLSGFTWNGTKGEYVEQSQQVWIFRKYTTVRFFFAENGLTLGKLKVTKLEDLDMEHALAHRDDNW